MFTRRRGLAVAAGAMAATVLPIPFGARRAWATDPTLTDYSVPTQGSYPIDIALGTDGNIWFTEFEAGKLGRLDPDSPTTIDEFSTGLSGSKPHGLVAADDALFFTDYALNKVHRMSTSGTITDTWSLPIGASGPRRIASGPSADSTLWFTAEVGGIGRLDFGSGTVDMFSLPIGSSNPAGICKGDDGSMWFALFGSNEIGEITTGASPAITVYDIPTAASYSRRICNGPDGNLWFTETVGNNLGKITTSGSITEYAIPTSAAAAGSICKGPEGTLWFSERVGGSTGKIGSYKPSTAAFNEYAVPTAGGLPAAICEGPNGDKTLWFTEPVVNKIGKVAVP